MVQFLSKKKRSGDRRQEGGSSPLESARDIERYQKVTSQKQQELVKVLKNSISLRQQNLSNKSENLNTLSPTNTMLRRYTIVNKEQQVITSTKDLSENDSIVLTRKDGTVDAKVQKVRCEDDE